MHVGFPAAEILGSICLCLSFPGSGRDVWVDAASRWWEGVRRAHVPGLASPPGSGEQQNHTKCSLCISYSGCAVCLHSLWDGDEVFSTEDCSSLRVKQCQWEFPGGCLKPLKVLVLVAGLCTPVYTLPSANTFLGTLLKVGLLGPLTS